MRLLANAAENQHTAKHWVEHRGCSLAGLENVFFTDAALKGVQVGLKGLQVGMRDLFCLVLPDLIEAKEGGLGLELVLEGIEENLILTLRWLAFLQGLMDLLRHLLFGVEVQSDRAL